MPWNVCLAGDAGQSISMASSHRHFLGKFSEIIILARLINGEISYSEPNVCNVCNVCNVTFNKWERVHLKRKNDARQRSEARKKDARQRSEARKKGERHSRALGAGKFALN
jgi:hypothetical protein